MLPRISKRSVVTYYSSNHTNVLPYVTNDTLHTDLHISFVRELAKQHYKRFDKKLHNQPPCLDYYIKRRYL